jgi:type VI secretion system secreted protein Hcp
MAEMAYLSLKGQVTGSIKGGITQKGREGCIGVIAVSHQIEAPYDATSGAPSGKRQHKPIKLTKEFDQSTPLLVKVLTTNENITDWKLDFFKKDPAGLDENAYRIELVNARLVSYEFKQADIRDPDKAKLACYEEVSFVYQKITWTCLKPTTISASDDWAA